MWYERALVAYLSYTQTFSQPLPSINQRKRNRNELVACDAPSSLCIYVIKVNNVSLNNIWVYDTSCGSYIWIDMQGIRSSRKLTKGESDFRVGNGARVVAITLWTYVLNLPSDFCLNLDDCCYVPSLMKIFFRFLI